MDSTLSIVAKSNWPPAEPVKLVDENVGVIIKWDVLMGWYSGWFVGVCHLPL